MANAKAKWYVQAGKLVSKLQRILDSVGGMEPTTRKKTLKTKAKVKATVAAGEGRRGRKVDPNSKSQLVKAYFEKNGFDHPLKEVVESLTKQHGQPFTVGLVANVKHRLGGTTHREKAAKPAKVKATAKVKAKKVGKVKAKKMAKSESKRGQTLWDVLNSILTKNPEGLKLGEITDLVKKSGYEYRGGKDLSGLKQNVWQCLNKMKKEGTHKGYEGTEPVVLHDASKKYLINPKATRKVA